MLAPDVVLVTDSGVEVASLHVVGDAVAGIYLVRNPGKLARIEEVVALSR